jgi:hypothetical protein
VRKRGGKTYYCARCRRIHRYDSSIGVKHLKYNPPPPGIEATRVTDPYTGEVIFEHYIELSPNYIIENFVPSEFVKRRGGIIRSIKHEKTQHVIRLGFWDRIDEEVYDVRVVPRHRYYTLISVLHPLKPPVKCKLKEVLEAEGVFDILIREKFIADGYIHGYRKPEEINKILRDVHKQLERERLKIVVPIKVPANPIGILEVL